MTDLSQFLIPKGFRFGAVKAGSSQRPHRLCPHRGRCAGQRRRRLHRQPRHRRAAHRGQGASARHRRQGARGGHQRRQRQLRRRQAGLDAARATCDAAAQASAAGRRRFFPPPPASSACRLPAEKLIAALPALAASLGSEFDHFQQVSPGHPDHRHGREDRLRAPGNRRPGWRKS
jgi:glutamate N-acetyltransferase/amino-acid N-acetyltransferase